MDFLDQSAIYWRCLRRRSHLPKATIQTESFCGQTEKSGLDWISPVHCLHHEFPHPYYLGKLLLL